MKNFATLRPTAAQLQQLQAKKDRKLAALDRRNERVTELQERQSSLC